MSIVIDSELSLYWNGPFTCRELLCSEENRKTFSAPGVYLWVDKQRDPSEISYVGKASGRPDLWTRLWDHYCSLIGGRYQLPGSACFDGRAWEMAPDHRDVVEKVFDKSQFKRLVDDAFGYVERLRIFLCKLDNAAPLKMIERQLLFELKPTDTKWGTTTPPIAFLKQVHESAGWAAPKVRNRLGDRVKFR